MGNVQLSGFVSSRADIKGAENRHECNMASTPWLARAADARVHGRAPARRMRIEVWTDRDRAYRQVLVQEYTFSPQGATFEHEDAQLDLSAISHMRL